MQFKRLLGSSWRRGWRKEEEEGDKGKHITEVHSDWKVLQKMPRQARSATTDVDGLKDGLRKAMVGEIGDPHKKSVESQRLIFQKKPGQGARQLQRGGAVARLPLANPMDQ